MALPDVIEPDQDESRPRALGWDDYVTYLKFRWNGLLSGTNSEPSVDEFVQRNPCLLPIGSGRGHHGPWLGAVFSQPRFQGRLLRVPDFMWIERNSAEVIATCVEIERPGKRWFNKDGTSNADLNQARDQISEWRGWFEDNTVETFFDTYYLPPEWLTERRFRQHYVLVYGRRSELTDNGPHGRKARDLNKKRVEMQRADEIHMTYDRLDFSHEFRSLATVRVEGSEIRVVAVPPTFETGRHVVDLVHNTVGLEEAIKQLSSVLPRDRIDYLIGRVAFWRSCPRTGRQIYGHGFE